MQKICPVMPSSNAPHQHGGCLWHGRKAKYCFRCGCAWDHSLWQNGWTYTAGANSWVGDGSDIWPSGEQVLKDEIFETPMCSIGTAEQVANQLQLQRQIDDTQNKLRSLEIQKSEWQDQAAQEELAAAERHKVVEVAFQTWGWRS